MCTGRFCLVVKVSAGPRAASPGQDKSSQAPETSRTYLRRCSLGVLVYQSRWRLEQMTFGCAEIVGRRKRQRRRRRQSDDEVVKGGVVDLKRERSFCLGCLGVWVVATTEGGKGGQSLRGSTGGRAEEYIDYRTNPGVGRSTRARVQGTGYLRTVSQVATDTRFLRFSIGASALSASNRLNATKASSVRLR